MITMEHGNEHVIIGIKWPKGCELWIVDELNALIEKLKFKSPYNVTLGGSSLADLRSGMSYIVLKYKLVFNEKFNLVRLDKI